VERVVIRWLLSRDVVQMNTFLVPLAQPVLVERTTIVELVLTKLELLAPETELPTLKLVPLAVEEVLPIIVPLANTRPVPRVLDRELQTPKPVHLALVVRLILAELVLTKLELFVQEQEQQTLKLVPLVVAEERLMLAELVLTKLELLVREQELPTLKLVPLAPEERPMLALSVNSKTVLLVLVLVLPTLKRVPPVPTVERPTLAQLAILLPVLLVLERR